MTTVQLAQRIARNLSETDITRMPAAVLQEVLDASNAAVQKVFKLLPRQYRETTISEVLLAPETVVVVISARASNLLTGTPFTAAQRGCAVKLTDDDHFNEVVSASYVLDGFLGTSLTGNATVYHDCIQLFQVIKEVTSPPRIYDVVASASIFGNSRELIRNDRIKAIRRGIGEPYEQRIGTPREYSIENVGMSQGGEPASFLRVYPMPDRDMRVRFEALVAPARITFQQIAGDAVQLPVPDDLCESDLLPIAAAELLTSKWWDNPNRKSVEDAAAAAAQRLGMEPTDVGVPRARMYTPTGF